jgi:hypothetical protein
MTDSFALQEAQDTPQSATIGREGSLRLARATGSVESAASPTPQDPPP